MTLIHALTRIVDFLRVGAPYSAAEGGHIALLALAPRRAGNDEIAAISAELVQRHGPLLTNIDVGVAIMRFTGEMPSVSDIGRVCDSLESAGCAVFDEFDGAGN